MIRVLHLIVSLDRGGAEKALFDLVSAPSTAIVPAVCTIAAGGSLGRSFRQVLNGRLFSLEAASRIDARALTRLGRLLANWQPDLLHTWMFHANILGRMAGRLARIPVVSTVRSLEHGKPLGRIILDRLTARVPVCTVAVSEAARRVAITRDGLAGSRTVVIPNGVPLSPVSSSPVDAAPKQPIIGAVGRLEKVKDHATLIRAVSRLDDAFGARLEIVGEGPERPRLEHLIQSLGLAGRAQLLGARDDVDEALSRWTVFAHPSLAEGMPRAVLEAMSHGLAIVATNAGGIPEALGSTGLLVPRGAIERLAEALARLLADASLRHTLGQQARNRVVAEFSTETFVARHHELYRRLTSHPEARAQVCA
jgi:glycosyltransferase involved in cell wall biosynthesis